MLNRNICEICKSKDINLIKKFNNYDVNKIKSIDLRNSEKAIISFK